MLIRIYNKLITNFSKITLFLLSLVLITAIFYSKNFNLDASSDALLLEGDQDLKYLREINERYGSKDFLFLTYTPITDFTDEDTIINLQLLKSKIEKLPKSILSTKYSNKQCKQNPTSHSKSAHHFASFEMCQMLFDNLLEGCQKG